LDSLGAIYELIHTTRAFHMLTTHTMIMVSFDKSPPMQGYLDARDVPGVLLRA